MNEPTGTGSAAALRRAVVEAEAHVHRFGWDGPLRVFALVRTAEAARREPELVAQLPADDAAAAAADPDHLLLVEQDGLEELGSDEDLETLLGRMAWPPEVDGVAVTVERLVVPPEVEAQAPADPEEAVRWLAGHPGRRDVRLAAGVLRDGARACVVRARSGGSDDAEDDLVTGDDLVPGLTAALAATLED
ncbi:PPA1309 family protein [Aquipuribacter nitratireducens]|uniref:PPA1309 family protein n=1 Tax=Aquipuribacter nitratireducens TaxID=650104 RepID=A0ABW0GLA4_9MICO